MMSIDTSDMLWWQPCAHCRGNFSKFPGGFCEWCGNTGEVAEDISPVVTLVHNLVIAGALFVAFRAGDNHGFHMGEDSSQCTCQWSPNVHGEAYKGATRCEQELLYEDDGHDDECAHCDYGCSECSPLVASGPNGCTCGFNGDCNCRFVP